MACYIISYDLRNRRDYASLYEAIKSYGTWAHILESTWAVVSEKATTEVRNHLISYMDNDDGLFVAQSSGIAAWLKVQCRDEWLQSYL